MQDKFRFDKESQLKTDAFEKYVTEATVAPGLTMAPFNLVLYPYYDILARTASLTAAYVSKVTDADGDHVVIVSFANKDGEADYSVWCSDKYLEGRQTTADEARQRCEEAVGTLPGKAKLVEKLLAAFKSMPESGRCSFWTDWRRDKKLCAHTSAALAQLRDTVPDFRTQLANAYEAATNGSTASGPVGETFVLQQLAFRVPVLFEGDRGAGKTFEAREFARTNGFKRVEFGGHEGIESPDMLGYLVPLDANRMVWKDGPVSEAFRAAKAGKVVLIIDELLRIRQRELSILLTALSPDQGMYRLRTGRIRAVEDDVAVEEELTCPVENLCVVATTNVGSEYAVDEIDPALAERFVPIRKDTTPAELKRILGIIAKGRSLPAKVVNQCVEFFNKMTEARTRGLVKHAPTTRTLARALELAEDTDDVKRAIKTQVLLWVARNAEGQPVAEQVADVEKLIDRCFK